MARARDAHCLPMFSGHEADGAPARSGQHRHAYLALTGDDVLTLWVAAPWRVDRTWTPGASDRRAFQEVAETLSTVRAGGLGTIALRARLDGLAPLLGPSRTWISATPYRPNRHVKRGQDATSAVAADIVAACARLGRPRPSVELDGAHMDGAISAHLRFTRPVVGPLMLGRDAHAGGGLFLPE
jgi:CRISPR-associated protein Csb2